LPASHDWDGRPVAVIVPGQLTTATGGFLYLRRMIEALSRTASVDRVVTLPARFPRGDEESLQCARAAIARLPGECLAIVDGLAFTALIPVLAERSDLRLVALVHHPLCDETGLTQSEREYWFAAERAALQRAYHVIVSSETTRRRLGDFALAPARVSVVRPGIDPPARLHRQGLRRGRSLTLLTVANLIPRKGQDELIRALIRRRGEPWRLILAGPVRDAGFARRLRLLLRVSGLAAQVTITGEVSRARLTRLYEAADLFILPSYHEGFGIALVEAVAHGVPVLTTTAGAIPEAVPAGTARFVAPGNRPALADALAQLIGRDRRQLIGLSRNAARASVHCRRWPEATAEFVRLVDRLRKAPS
jgi:glycosyltransferase involved in cell wall biosynthesis